MSIFFVKNNPAEASAAAQCKSIDEFKKLADDNGIKFEDDKTAEEAFEYVKENCSNAELERVHIKGLQSSKYWLSTQILIQTHGLPLTV